MSDATKWKAGVHTNGLTWSVYDADGEPIVWEAGGCDKTAALQIVTDHNEAQGLKAEIMKGRAELDAAKTRIAKWEDKFARFGKTYGGAQVAKVTTKRKPENSK